MTILKYVLWYIYLSAIDWTIHKYILHSESETMMRSDHRVHHYAHDNDINLDTGTTFCLTDALAVYVLSAPPLVLLYGLWGALLHFLAVMVGFGIHNYAHMLFHNIKPASDWIWRVPVPKFWYEALHRNHEQHHLKPKTCYCTAYLGFDYLIGTC